MPQTYTQLYYHLVFSTRDRQPTIAPEWRPALHAFIGGIVRTRRGALVAAGGVPDHLHLLVRLPADLSVSDAVRDIKAVSSGWRHAAGDPGFWWQNGYGAFSVSRSQVEPVTRYLDRQEEHQRGRTFRDEFLGLLDAHGVGYDPHHLWD